MLRASSTLRHRATSALAVRCLFAETKQQLPQPDRQPQVKYTKLFINNEWHGAISGKTFPVTNPADGKTICEVHQADKKDVDKAVQAATDAFKLGSPWRRMDATDRGTLLNKLADAIEKNAAYIASLEALNSGIPFNRTYTVDVPAAAEFLRYYAGWANKNHGKVIPVRGNFFCFTRHEPVGVCAQITPWNVPLLMCASKLAPALSMGNTVVLKPAEYTPLTSLYVAQLCREVGFPPGVVNVISGFGETGASLVAHPKVHKISFTGSTEVGQHIMASAAKHIKRVTLELGGKSPNIILSDADFNTALYCAHLGVYFNQGQACIAGSRLFVEESIYKDFVEHSVELAKKRRIGDPFDLTVEQGPQITEEHMNTILRYVQTGKKQGAKLCTGGARIGDKGYYLQPTVFSDVTDDMTIAKEEIFGPVMNILKFKNYNELIERANDTSYGLAAGIFTKDMGRALDLAQGIRAGIVWVNCYLASDVSAPFGGFKMSGIGREGGDYALQHYTEVKTVVMPVNQKNS